PWRTAGRASTARHTMGPRTTEPCRGCERAPRAPGGEGAGRPLGNVSSKTALSARFGEEVLERGRSRLRPYREGCAAAPPAARLKGPGSRNHAAGQTEGPVPEKEGGCRESPAERRGGVRAAGGEGPRR